MKGVSFVLVWMLAAVAGAAPDALSVGGARQVTAVTNVTALQNLPTWAHLATAMATSGTSRPSGLAMGMGMGSTGYIQAGGQPGFVAGTGPQAVTSFRGHPNHAAPLIPGAQNNGRRKVVMAMGMPTTPLLPVGPWGSWGSRPLAQ